MDPVSEKFKIPDNFWTDESGMGQIERFDKNPNCITYTGLNNFKANLPGGIYRGTSQLFQVNENEFCGNFGNHDREKDFSEKYRSTTYAEFLRTSISLLLKWV